jgi:hypothetical protein
MPNIQIDHCTQSITSRQVKPQQPGSFPPVFRLLIAPDSLPGNLCSILLYRLSRAGWNIPRGDFNRGNFSQQVRARVTTPGLSS